MAEIVNIGIPSGDTNFILRVGGRMLLISLAVMFLSIGASFFTSKAAMSFGRDLRGEVFRKVTHYSLHEADKIGIPSLITRTTNDVIQLQMLTMFMLRTLVSSPLHMVGGVIMAVSKDPTLSLIFVLAVPIMSLIIIFNIKWVTPLFRLVQDKLDNVNRVFRETLSGIRVIRAFNRINHEKERFNNANKDLTETSLSAFRRMAIMEPFTMLTVDFAIIAIFLYGSRRVDGGHMMTGDLMAFIQYAMRILFSIMMATRLFVMIPRAAVSERIGQVLDMETEVTDPVEPQSPPANMKGFVRFENVSFRYPGAEQAVLSDISFEANQARLLQSLVAQGQVNQRLLT